MTEQQPQPFFKDKVVLVTGGAGSIGKELVKRIVTEPVQSVRAFDIDEYNLANLKSGLKSPKLRALLGDICDRERVKLALNGVDYVFHLAAIKNLEISEYNVPQCVRCNVDGTINLVECALERKPQKFLFCSSDKSTKYVSLYGASKFIGEKTVLWANQIQDYTKFAVARLPNVVETRGNIFEKFPEHKLKGKPIPLTNPKMKRYFMSLDSAVSFLMKAAEKMRGGEVFVPANVEERSVLEIAKSYGGKIEIIGKRKGEKIREELMTEEERKKAERADDMWIIRKE